MSNNETNIKIVEKKSSQVELLPSGKSILEQLSIDPSNIKSIQPRWKRSNYRAIINWLTKYKANSNDSNLDKVKSLLETFFHLCGVEDWKRAGKILYIPVQTPNRELLHNQLSYWGYYQKQIELYKQVLHKLSEEINALFLNSLGSSYSLLGKYDESLNYYQESLEVVKKINDKVGIASALAGIGTVYYNLGDCSQAFESQQLS